MKHFITFFFIFLMIFGFQQTVKSQTSQRNNGFSVTQVADFKWNSDKGLPYKRGYESNYGVAAFQVINSSQSAFLFNTEPRIRIFDHKKNTILQDIELSSVAMDFLIHENKIYVLDFHTIKILSLEGELQNEITLPPEVRFIESIQVFNNQLFVVTPNGKSHRVAVNGKTINAKPLMGVMVDEQLSVKTVRNDAKNAEVILFKNGSKISDLHLKTDKKFGAIQVIGKGGDFLYLDIEYIENEKPLDTYRKIVAYKIVYGEIQETNFSIVLPDIYYIEMKHDCRITENGLHFLLTAPDKTVLYQIEPQQTNREQQHTFPAELFEYEYHYNQHTLDASELEGSRKETKKTRHPDIYRGKIIANAESYETYKWIASEDNIKDYYCGQKQVRTPTWVQVGENRSMPYMWGGFSSFDWYEDGLKTGWSAGDNITNTSYGATYCAVGVDCSGFASLAWNTEWKYGTSTLPQISDEYSSYDNLKPGDILNRSGHVRIVHTMNDDGTILTIEATSRDNVWRVVYNNYSYSDLQAGGYKPRYYHNVVEDADTLILHSPEADENRVQLPVRFYWSDMVEVDNYTLQVALSPDNWNENDGFTADTEPNAKVPVNVTVPHNYYSYVWTEDAAGAFSAPQIGQTYYWTMKVTKPGSAETHFTQPIAFTTLADEELPTTEITVESFANQNFTATFTDADDIHLADRFYLVTDFDGETRSANTAKGFLYDNFHSEEIGAWTGCVGNWHVENEQFRQDDVSITASANRSLTQNENTDYLYCFDLIIEEQGNKQAGFAFFQTDQNKYQIVFDATQATYTIGKTEETTITKLADGIANIEAGVPIKTKVLYSAASGTIQLFVDDLSIGSVIDNSPLLSGEGIALQTIKSAALFDNIMVYKSRGSTCEVEVGENGEARYQNTSPELHACRLYSLVTDAAGKISTQVFKSIGIDWTPPEAVPNVNDGLEDDVDTVYVLDELSANWDEAEDLQSGVYRYYYAIGSSPGETDIVSWRNNALYTSKTRALFLNRNTTYYFSVKVQNNAGLFSDVTSSDGVLVDEFADAESRSMTAGLRVYPNPAKESISVMFKHKDNTGLRVQILNIQGKTLYDEKISKKTIKIHHTINLQNIESGIYFLRICGNDFIENKKIIVVNE